MYDNTNRPSDPTALCPVKLGTQGNEADTAQQANHREAKESKRGMREMQISLKIRLYEAMFSLQSGYVCGPGSGHPQ